VGLELLQVKLEELLEICLQFIPVFPKGTDGEN
jgi:hypothetical protein